MQHLKSLPSPKASSLFGHIKDLRALDKHKRLEQWAIEYNGFYRIRLGVKDILVSGNSDFNNFVLKNRPYGFRRMKKLDDVMNEMTIKGIFTAEGEQWKKHRKITMKALDRKNTKSYFPIIKKHLLRFAEVIKNTESAEVIINDFIQKLTIDITTEIAFGYDGNTQSNQEDELQSNLSTIFPVINQRISSILPLWKIIKTKKVKEFNSSLSAVKNHINDLITTSKKTKKDNKPLNFLDQLIIESEKDTISDDELFGNVFTMLLAGEDTTSNSICWVIYYLAQYPEVCVKARAEIKKINKSLEEFEALDLEKCTFLQAIVLETLRLKPVAPTLLFQTLEDTTCNNIALKKGDTVLLQNKVAQTEEQNFTNANDFQPNRWINPEKRHNETAFKPFGAGARLCPGKALAIDEIKSLIVILLQEFTFELTVSPDEVKEVAAFAMQPENLKLRFNKINL